MNRVTNLGQNMMISNNLYSGVNKYQTLQENLLTGKKVSKIYDDPLNSGKILGIKNRLSDITTYKTNISLALSEVNSIDSTLSTLTDKVIRAKELALSVSNEAKGDSSIEAIKSELNQLIETFNGLANSNYNGKYLFSGTNTLTKPYSNDGGKFIYQGTKDGSTKQEILIDDDLKISYNVSGNDLFGEYDPNNGIETGIFGAIGALVNELNQANVNMDNVRLSIDKFENCIQNVVQKRADIGVIAQNLETKSQKYDDDLLNNKTQLSTLEETDYVSAITDLLTQQYALQASMQVASGLSMPSLLNYM